MSATNNTNTTAIFEAYKEHCAELQALGTISAKPAYAVQALLLQGKEVTPEQRVAYASFEHAVLHAQTACMQVKGKATACGIFNYLDGRVTGHKVATSLGNSVSLRMFIEGMATLAGNVAQAVNDAIDATPALATATGTGTPTNKAAKKAHKASK